MWLPWRRKSKREIFEFRDGAGMLRRVDPLVVYNGLFTDEELRPEDHFAMLEPDAPEELQRKAQPVVARAARRLFGLASFSDDQETGVTDGEAIGTLISFVEWMSGQKKSTNTQPT